MARETARLEIGTVASTAVGVVAAVSLMLGVMAVLLYPVLQALQGGS